MDPIVLIVILVVAATLLLFGDLFIPSGGVMSVIGAGLLLTAVVVCFTINRWLGLVVLFAVVLSSPFVAAGMIKAWQMTPIGKRMTLASGPAPSPVPMNVVRVGAVGRTLTALRPMGEAEFPRDTGGSAEVQVTAESGDLPADTVVRVIHFKDGLATVRAHVPEATEIRQEPNF